MAEQRGVPLPTFLMADASPGVKAKLAKIATGQSIKKNFFRPLTDANFYEDSRSNFISNASSHTSVRSLTISPVPNPIASTSADIFDHVETALDLTLPNNSASMLQASFSPHSTFLLESLSNLSSAVEEVKTMALAQSSKPSSKFLAGQINRFVKVLKSEVGNGPDQCSN